MREWAVNDTHILQTTNPRHHEAEHQQPHEI